MAFHWLDFLLITNLWDKTELLLTGSVKISTFSGKPTKVEFHVTVMSLDSINEGSMVSHRDKAQIYHQIQLALQTYAADIFFGQSWDDHRLKLPVNMTSAYRLLPVEWLGTSQSNVRLKTDIFEMQIILNDFWPTWSEEIWRPDSFFKNAKAVTFQRMTIPNHYLWLYKSKKIMYMVKWVLGHSYILLILLQ